MDFPHRLIPRGPVLSGMAQLLPDHLHPSQQRLQLLDLQRCSHQLAAGEDRQLAVEHALTMERIRRQLPNDLERVLIDAELQFAGNGAPEQTSAS